MRLLDNRYALLFIRGERPIKDLKYDIMKHPRVALTADGKGEQYIHGSTDAATLTFDYLGESESKDAAASEQSDYELLSEDDVERLILSESKKEVSNLEEKRKEGTE